MKYAFQNNSIPITINRFPADSLSSRTSVKWLQITPVYLTLITLAGKLAKLMGTGFSTMLNQARDLGMTFLLTSFQIYFSMKKEKKSQEERSRYKSLINLQHFQGDGCAYEWCNSDKNVNLNTIARSVTKSQEKRSSIRQ